MNRSGYTTEKLEFFAVCLAIVAVFLLLGAMGKNATKASLEAKPPAGDCVACHGDQQVLPPGHADTRDMMMAGCTQCHTRTERNLWSRINLGHLHALNAIGCEGCHQDPVRPAPLSTGDCLACHTSFEAVAALTATLHPDPHHSPHYGIIVDCDLCHRIHKASENFCAQCHDWTFVVP